jgi:hypothetical protein
MQNATLILPENIFLNAENLILFKDVETPPKE